MLSVLRSAAAGPRLRDWVPPHWLFPHQVVAAQRVGAALVAFQGAILADAVGFGKTYVSLAVASRYRRAAVVAPAAILPQWERTSRRLRVPLQLVSAESLSRTRSVPATDLVIVDEAHRFRNPRTRRYDRLARGVGRAHVLLVTATPVVNRGTDLVHLLRLFLPDNGLAVLGVPSLEAVMGETAFSELVYAMAPLVVARSATTLPQAGSLIPPACDAGLVRASPVHTHQLKRLLSLIDDLSFPGFGSGHARTLMRRHAVHRLASSTAAFRETIRRHLRYVDRAMAACGRGEQLARSAARQLFGVDEDFQLELLESLRDSTPRPIDPATLQSERNRLEKLLGLISDSSAPNPKVEKLQNLVRARRERKTIVFTTAIATALDLAQRFGWRELAAVAGGRAWIASGRIPVEEALSLFAPRARGVACPPPASRVILLIATDLASEGLDLQDADAIVHFDLPWTPLRLSQRLGRVARLGSPHAVVRVWWFAPPLPLARRMGLERRIAEKVRVQLGLGVANTSCVGRARITNALLEWRHRLSGDGSSTRSAKPGHAVVRAHGVAAFAVRWSFPDSEITELAVLRGDPPQRITDYPEAWWAMESLRRGDSTEANPPPAMLTSLRQLIRARLSASERGPQNAMLRALARRVLQRARTAGHNRAMGELSVLDVVLDRLTNGVPVGAERELHDALRHADLKGLRTWIDRHPSRRRPLATWRLDAALFGMDSDS